MLPQLLRRAVTALGAAALATGVLASQSIPASASTIGGFRYVGDMAWPGTMGDEIAGGFNTMRLAIDSGAGLASVYVASQKTGYPMSQVVIYDLHTMRPVRTVVAPIGEDAGGNPMDPTVDTLRHRVVYPCALSASCPNSAEGYVVIDELKGTSSLVLAHLPPGSDDAMASGLWYDAASDSYYTTIVGPSPQYHPAGNFAGTYDLAPGAANMWLQKLSGATLALDWQVELPYSTSCNYLEGNGVAWAHDPLLERQNGRIAIFCNHISQEKNVLTGDAGLNVLTYVATNAQGDALLDASGNPELTTVPGVGDFFADLADPVHHRVAMVSGNAALGLGAYVLDTSTGLVEGTVSTDTGAAGNSGTDQTPDSPSQAGVDTSTGRLYMLTASGLFYSDIGRSRLAPPVDVTGIRDTWTNQVSVNFPGGRIEVDPATHHLYFPDASKSVYHVYQDLNPPSAAPPPPNPDEATQDIAEVPGQTAANFSGAADAFGVRYLDMGGPGRPVCAHIANSGAGQPCPTDSVITPGDRDWYLGHVAGAALSNDGASAAAAVYDFADTATQHDLASSGIAGGGTQPDVAGTLTGAGMFWPAGVQSCSDYGQTPQKQSGGGGEGTADADCDLAAQTVTADSTSDGQAGIPAGTSTTPEQLGITIGRYEAHTTVRTDSAAGTVVQSEARAENVTVTAVTGLTLFTAREIDTGAESVAHGRPGTAHGSFDRTIQGFSSSEYTCDSSCDPARVVQAIDDAFAQAGVIAYAFAANPDPAYYPGGSPGGYQALVTKQTELRSSDIATDDDGSDTVVGLEIVEYQDSQTQGRSRQVIQFAGVHAESHYGIYALPQFTAPDCGTLCQGTGAVSTPAPAPGPGARTVVAGVSAQGRPGVWGVISAGWALARVAARYLPALAGLWVLLLAPLYFAMRRRAAAVRLDAS